jgi:tetratricopeptide (TPR) repeat protein
MHLRAAKRAALTILLLVSAACSRHGDAPGAPASVSSVAAPASSASPPPPQATTLKAPPTTDPGIAISNLDAEISDREKKAAKGDVGARLELVPRYLMRAQFEGKVSDLSAADDASKSVLAARPSDASAHLARESALSAIHEFAAATAELDAAAKLGADADDVARARAGVLLATGREDDAKALLPSVDEVPVPLLVIRGAIEARRGDAAESGRLFDLARARYRDVSPFTLAWIDFERARALETTADRSLARPYLAEAATVLPGYAHAVVHLAAFDPPDRALARLRDVERTSDDPEVIAGEADALRRAGQTDEAAAAAGRARARFEEVLGRMRLAFADHAAQFFLGMGADPARALSLAKVNVENRPTDEAVELWLTAAQAAGSHADTCAAAARALALVHATDGLRERATAASKGCT